jgi:glycosyltransferase involved in cell wall biosynthesis
MPVQPILTVVIPTQGRETLHRALASIRAQAGPEDVQLLVVADTHSVLQGPVRSIAAELQADYAEHDAGYHDWGYPQLDYGYKRASGRYIMNIGDDDIWLPGAYGAIRLALGQQLSPRPLMFKAELQPSPNRGDQRVPVVLWSDRRDLRRGRITGQNLCAPNVQSKLGRWTDDFSHTIETINLWNVGVDWIDAVICRCY